MTEEDVARWRKAKKWRLRWQPDSAPSAAGEVDGYTAQAEGWQFWSDGRDLVPYCPECSKREFRAPAIAVHIGARIAGLAGAGEVLVSRTVRDLVAGSGIDFEERGQQELKGVPGEWELYLPGEDN